jgi:hypothetical protein
MKQTAQAGHNSDEQFFRYLACGDLIGGRSPRPTQRGQKHHEPCRLSTGAENPWICIMLIFGACLLWNANWYACTNGNEGGGGQKRGRG